MQETKICIRISESDRLRKNNFTTQVSTNDVISTTNNRTHSSMPTFQRERSTTNLEDALTEIVLGGSRGMEPMRGHRMPASDRSHREQYPLLSTLLPTHSHSVKTTKFCISQHSFNQLNFLHQHKH